MDYFRYQEYNRDPYFVDRRGHYIQFRDGAALNLNLRVVHFMYWKNRIHMDMDHTPQVRHVGWEWEAGIHVPFLPIDLFQHHHSRHWLEGESPRGDDYPIENSYGIRFKFIENGEN